jgi:hypothetical protein
MLSTQQVADRAGVHKLTLIRWMKEGRVAEPSRDWRGWRVFDEGEAMSVVAFARSGHPTAAPAEDVRIVKLKEFDWSFSGAKTSYLTHGIHPYPAKFIPQIPNALIQELSSVGDTVADIFCGSGTTLLEALQLKRNAVGIDANPLAALISQAKVSTPTEDTLDELRAFRLECDLLASQIAANFSSKGTQPFVSEGWRPEPSVSEFWFIPHVVEELAEVRLRIGKLSESAQLLAKTAFSAIIVAVSLQDSDTRYVRRDKAINPSDVVRRFCNALSSTIIASSEVADILEDRFNCRIVNSDILSAPDVGMIDLVVTSPPYPNAFSYHLYHRTRMLWLEQDQKRFKSEEIGSHRKYSAKGASGLSEDDYLREFTTIFRWLADRMRPGSHACFVMGDSTIRGRRIDNSNILSSAGYSAGFIEAARIDREILSTKKSFNPSHGRIKRENILILKRSA